MPEEIISKKEIEEFKEANAQMIGSSFIQDLKFILDHEGEEGLKTIENLVRDNGYPLEYRKINPKKFYPIWIGTVILVVAERLFKYDDKKFEEMGRFNAKTNFLSRILLKYFISEDTLARSASKIWKRYHSVGELKTIEYNKEKRWAVLRLYDFPAYPIICRIMKGYFEELLEFVVKKKVYCEETKCTLRGDSYHEFRLTW